ncbi:MAG: glycosyltransferase family 4 protein, partial [Methanomicrobiales archaeon]|nr:glycosyltransferase family 4 protein [Methanomicrobiales archaeon]
MKILHTVQRYAPDTGGSEEVVRQLSERLVSSGHDVTVATGTSDARDYTELNGVKIVQFACSGNAVEGLRGDIDAYRGFIRNERFDVMMNYAAQIWSTDLAFDLLPELNVKRVLVPCGYSRLRDPLFASYFEKMPDTLRLYDRVVYLSENYIDKEFGDAHGLQNGVVIPNGADTREFLGAPRGTFRSRHGIGDRLLLLNVSNHSRLKNHAFFWNVVSGLDAGGVCAVLVANAYTRGPAKWLKECYASCRFRSG